MFEEAVSAVRSAIENDAAFQSFAAAVTGSDASVAYENQDITPPCVVVAVTGGRADSTRSGEVQVELRVLLPLYGEDAYLRCLQTADIVSRALLGVKCGSGIVQRVELGAIEQPGESESTWVVNFVAAVLF